MSDTTESIALIIPCFWKDAGNLIQLLENIEKHATVFPQEIFVVLSEYELINKQDFLCIEKNIQQLNQRCHTQLLLRKEKCLAGDNRNYGIKNSVSDIIVCHDSDDDFHPQKIEILKHWYKKRPECVCIMHWFQPYGYKWKIYDCIDEIHVDEPYTVDLIGFKNYAIGPLMRGHPSFRRFVFDAVQFPDYLIYGEDLQFCISIAEKYPKSCLVVRACLCKYDYDVNINPAIVNWGWEKIDEPNGMIANRSKNGWIENMREFPSGRYEN